MVLSWETVLIFSGNHIYSHASPTILCTLLPYSTDNRSTLLCCMQKVQLPSLQQIKPTTWLRFSPSQCTTFIPLTMLSDIRCTKVNFCIVSSMLQMQQIGIQWRNVLSNNSTLTCLHIKYYGSLQKKQYYSYFFQVISIIILHHEYILLTIFSGQNRFCGHGKIYKT